MENTQKKAENTVEQMKRGQIPDEARELAQRTVAAGRESFDRVSNLANENARDFQGVMAAGFDGGKAINEKIMQNIAHNTQMALDAAQELAQARSLPEAAQIYSRLMQRNLAEFTRQTQEFMELSQHAMRSTMDKYQTVATRSVDRAQRTATEAQQAYQR